MPKPKNDETPSPTPSGSNHEDQLEQLPTKTEAGAPVPAGTFDYGEDSGKGFETVTAKDLSVPFILVLQTNSPQCDGPTAMTAARPGMLLNSVTGQLWPGETGVVVQPCYRELIYTEWLPRDAGGGSGKGFVGTHDPGSEFVREIILKAQAEADGKFVTRLKTDDGHELVETHLTYAQLLSDDGARVEGFGVIGATSTKIKPYRDWLTSMYLLGGTRKPPIFAHRARFRTIQQQNTKGKFYNFRITPLKGDSWLESLISPTAERDLLLSGRAFAEMAQKGLARANFESASAAGEEPAGGAGAETGAEPGTKPPF